jgi:hypothetical protein
MADGEGRAEIDMHRSMAKHRARARWLAAGAAASWFGLIASAAVRDPVRAPDCKASGALVKIAELPEASGLASSRAVPGRLWAIDDSGEPVLFALDTRGAVTGRVRLSGAAKEDWEAVAVGPCPAGSCIYVGDIGDNDARRDRITVYRLPEPTGVTGSATVNAVFHATYPDGPHDAEALFVPSDGRIHVVTKGEKGAVALFRFPPDPGAGSTVRLEQVGQPRNGKSSPSTGRITDGSVSPDGRWIALRNQNALTFYRSADLLAGEWLEAGRVDLEPLGEPQGEGVAFGAPEAIYLIGEGGGKSRPGTFGRLVCRAGR